MSREHIQKFKAGDYFFREGDTADCAYIIESGRVSVYLRKEGIDGAVANLGPGDIFGEMAVIDGLPRSASVMAVEDCVVSTVSRKLLNERIADSDPIVRLLITLLLKRMRNSTPGKGKVDETQPLDLEQYESCNLSAEGRDRLRLENELLQAVDKREFFLNYQEILNLQTRSLLGFEALLRWQSPVRGLVRPDLFINLAEQTSVIVPLGYWILEQAMNDLRVLQAELQNDKLFMSINVSVRQLLDPQFVKRVNKIAERAKVDPKTVKLEVTERVFQEDPIVLQTVSSIRENGFEISLDDFGTGYSSLTSLFAMQVDNIKVDRSFVCNLLKEPKSRAIVQAVVAMGVQLGLSVVAEGIENESEALVLTAMGCQSGQGYLFGKPQGLDKAIAKFGVKTAVAS